MTTEETAAILLEQIGHQTASAINWPDPATKSRAYNLANEIGGTSLNASASCTACDVLVVDTIRRAAGLRPLTQQARKETIEARRAACTTCPAYREGTDSCGRLVVDAFLAGPVVVDGREVQPCGCRLFGVLGAARKMDHKCPAGRW
jgi:hypothetical protein